MPNQSHHPLAGSERTPLHGARAAGAADPNERMEVTVVVRPRDKNAMAHHLAQAQAGKFLTREEFEREHGADQKDLEAVADFAHQHNLVVVEKSAARRSVILSGTVANFSQAFNIELRKYEHPNGTYRGRTGPIHIPDNLKDIVTAVLGLDNRPQAKAHFRRVNTESRLRPHTPSSSLTAPQVAQLYDFPAGGTGAGQTIALIELGGGFKPADLANYFKGLGIEPAPTVTAVSVDRAHNRPTGSADGPDGEVMLDIEVAGAVAPQAHIAVYFAPNTDQGFLNAVTTAIHDKVNNPSVISISWGGPESSWTAQATRQFDQAFQEAATLGVTVTVASGDSGSTDGVSDGGNHVDFPASDPWVLACGGTRLIANHNAIGSETVWNDGAQGGATGGGVSAVFPEPGYQSQANINLQSGGNGRGVPDVSGDADPVSGYQVIVDGDKTVIGGTSAVAPLWAGLIALINQLKGGPRGFINPKLYQNPGALHDITASGNNGAFKVVPGWDPCTGLGSPDGAKLQNVI